MAVCFVFLSTSFSAHVQLELRTGLYSSVCCQYVFYLKQIVTAIKTAIYTEHIQWSCNAAVIKKILTGGRHGKTGWSSMTIATGELPSASCQLIITAQQFPGQDVLPTGIYMPTHCIIVYQGDD